MKILQSVLLAAVLMTGGNVATAMATDTEIWITNLTGSNITRQSQLCLGATCPATPVIIQPGIAKQKVFHAYMNTSSTSALLIFEYGTYSQRCRATVNLTTLNSQVIGITGTPSRQVSRGTPTYLQSSATVDLGTGIFHWDIAVQ